MKVSVIVYAAAVMFLFSLQEEKVSAQVFTPSQYSGGPLSYGYEDNDDDFGVLLALLLLAARNRGGNGCCQNCNNVRTVPVPFPVPFLTNNPVFLQNNDDDEPSDNDDKNTPVINIKTENNDETPKDTDVKTPKDTDVNNAPNSNANSSSTSSSIGDSDGATSSASAASSDNDKPDQ